MSTSSGVEDTSTSVELLIGGMTCAACANRIEKRLNKMEGVTASVNFATEKARVSYGGSEVALDDLIAQVEKIGFTATPPRPEPTPGEETVEPEDPTDALWNRALISLVLSVPVIAMAMIPALQFTHWQWASLVLAAPVVVWGALPFHVAAWKNLRLGTATMDTLVSLGVSAAFLWSLYALFLGTAGEPGMK